MATTKTTQIPAPTAARVTVPLHDPRTIAMIWQSRCRDLAAQHGLTATLHGRSARGISLYSVPSSSTRGAVHLVRYHSQRRQIECDCLAARFGCSCGHAGAVLIALDAQERHAAEQNEQWRWWLNGGDEWSW